MLRRRHGADVPLPADPDAAGYLHSPCCSGGRQGAAEMDWSCRLRCVQLSPRTASVSISNLRRSDAHHVHGFQPQNAPCTRSSATGSMPTAVSHFLEQAARWVDTCAQPTDQRRASTVPEIALWAKKAPYCACSCSWYVGAPSSPRGRRPPAAPASAVAAGTRRAGVVHVVRFDPSQTGGNRASWCAPHSSGRQVVLAGKPRFLPAPHEWPGV